MFSNYLVFLRAHKQCPGGEPLANIRFLLETNCWRAAYSRLVARMSRRAQRVLLCAGDLDKNINALSAVCPGPDAVKVHGCRPVGQARRRQVPVSIAAAVTVP